MDLMPDCLTSTLKFMEGEFSDHALLYQKVPFGISFLDRDLRYYSINERMAAIIGKSIEQHLGRTVREVDEQVGLAFEPIFRHAIEEGAPLEELEIEVSFPAESSQTRHWIVSCYPFKSEDSVAHGIGVVVQDITEQKQKEAKQVERLKFEALLSDLSAAFINVPESEVDRKIEQELEKVVDFFGVCRSSVWQYSPEDGRLQLSHSHSLPGTKQPPSIIDHLVPAWMSKVRLGELFYISDVEEMPDNFWREKKYCVDQGGIKSILFIPLSVGGNILGVISFVSLRSKKTWTDEFSQRMRLLGEIFANVLERKRASQNIQKAFAEIKQLKVRLEAENLYLRDQIEIEHKHEEIIGQSESIRKALLQVEQVASTDSTVLLLGETGTGKELMARAIHNLSVRKNRAMIKVNCATLPATMIEAELFGYVRGAYTGAFASQIGRFEAANGSTIFLDEIGELPIELQSKLLRVLQEGQFERLGSPKPIEVDVRIIAATNRDLVHAIKEGKFREDLFYRLNVFPILIPPLRERREDIPALVWAMVKEFGAIFGKTIERIPKKCMDSLERYNWPGNIRELRNLIERAMILNNGSTLVADLPEGIATTTTQFMSMEEIESMHILDVLEMTGWRVRGNNGAAEILRLKPTTLEARMKKLGIKRKNR